MNVSELQRAIAKKCLECTCHQPEEIRQCDITDCPLHGYRPDQTKREPAVRRKIIKPKKRKATR